MTLTSAGAELSKTSSHLTEEVRELLQDAIDRANDVKSAGGGRARGYASLIVLAAGLIFQSGGLLVLKQAPPTVESVNEEVSSSPSQNSALVASNIRRIEENINRIASVKARVVPSLDIDSNVLAIRSSTEDLRLLLLADGRAPQK